VSEIFHVLIKKQLRYNGDTTKYLYFWGSDIKKESASINVEDGKSGNKNHKRFFEFSEGRGNVVKNSGKKRAGTAVNARLNKPWKFRNGAMDRGNCT